jgi:hypothetical protein
MALLKWFYESAITKLRITNKDIEPLYIVSTSAKDTFGFTLSYLKYPQI